MRALCWALQGTQMTALALGRAAEADLTHPVILHSFLRGHSVLRAQLQDSTQKPGTSPLTGLVVR